MSANCYISSSVQEYWCLYYIHENTHPDVAHANVPRVYWYFYRLVPKFFNFKLPLFFLPIKKSSSAFNVLLKVKIIFVADRNLSEIMCYWSCIFKLVDKKLLSHYTAKTSANYRRVFSVIALEFPCKFGS